MSRTAWKLSRAAVIRTSSSIPSLLASLGKLRTSASDCQRRLFAEGCVTYRVRLTTFQFSSSNIHRLTSHFTVRLRPLIHSVRSSTTMRMPSTDRKSGSQSPGTSVATWNLAASIVASSSLGVIPTRAKSFCLALRNGAERPERGSSARRRTSQESFWQAGQRQASRKRPDQRQGHTLLSDVTPFRAPRAISHCKYFPASK